MKSLTSRPCYRKGSWGGAGPQTRGGEAVRLSFQTDPLPSAPCSSLLNQSSAAQSSKCLPFFLSQTINLNFWAELRVNKPEDGRPVSQVHFTFPTPEQGHTIHDQLPLVTTRHLKYTFYRNGVPVSLAEDFNSIPSTQVRCLTIISTSSSGGLDTSGIHRHADTCRTQTHTHVIENEKN